MTAGPDATTAASQAGAAAVQHARANQPAAAAEEKLTEDEVRLMDSMGVKAQTSPDALSGIGLGAASGLVSGQSPCQLDQAILRAHFAVDNSPQLHNIDSAFTVS